MFNLGRVQSVFAKCGSHSTTNTTPFVILTAGSLYGMMMETIRLTERGCGQADVETLAVTLGFLKKMHTATQAHILKTQNFKYTFFNACIHTRQNP